MPLVRTPTRSMRLANAIPLGCSLLLLVGTVNCVQTLKAVIISKRADDAFGPATDGLIRRGDGKVWCSRLWTDVCLQVAVHDLGFKMLLRLKLGYVCDPITFLSIVSLL